ncbi:MAG: nucleotide exchange factor GrpE [Candidatus Pacebacteria bacterium]|nr:nucleotide exchange factor GrpE [Candidatus Paceibacterota bacterium]
MNDKDTKKNTENVSENINNESLSSDLDIEIEETEYEGISQKDKLKKLRDELKEVKKQSQEYLTGWQKERADFANYKSEEEKKRKEKLDSMKLNLVSDFFPVLDSFDMAFSNKEAWEKVDSAWRTGVEYIHSQFMNTLELYNVSIIEKVGNDFDPKIHDPIEHIEVDNEEDDNKILHVIQKGYMSGDTVLRPAKVKVGKYENK